jgi:DNA-binding transcriptional LysR family regulator
MNVKSFLVDDETVIRMVEKGLGVTMMAELMIKGRTKNVLAIPVDPYLQLRELGMATHIKRKDTINILKLKKCILQYISEINPQEAS